VSTIARTLGFILSAGHSPAVALDAMTIDPVKTLARTRLRRRERALFLNMSCLLCMNRITDWPERLE
jgi:hypothetical protein